ncbi:PREDICTED: urokinase plasminogen activator surface receptor-like isoform X2 [Acropora digitifera]|uniref:urokinase plasminogen activator surface receptor-like isoform X2 n=1 Tax=Acropora digitifera TaxID=70779 RepID=UPI00077A1DB0|nr:PREDICTED: urokinase plasminogen activator surface receptor-like isoform X2 [Acropora digitifera]
MMALKISSSLLVSCLFFSLGVTLPTSTGLSCYLCHEYIGSASSCSNPSVINCDSSLDSCVTVTSTMEIFGMSFSSTLKNCSHSSLCGSNFVCNQLSDIPELKSCSMTCCSGNLCNGQSGQTQGKREDTSLKSVAKKRAAKASQLLRRTAKEMELLM